MEKEINNIINTIDKIYFLEDQKLDDYYSDFEEFKKDIPKLEEELLLLKNFKKYLKIYKDKEGLI